MEDAGAHHRDPVGERQGLLLVVRDVQDRRPHAPLEGLQLDPHLLAQPGVQVRQRLVEEQDRGIGRQGAGERHALLLAAGELVRVPPIQAVEPGQLEQARDPPRALGGATRRTRSG